MPSKIIIYDDEARKQLKIGYDAVANAVKPTIGPLGRNVAFKRSFGNPVITNDGVSIAREIFLKDPFQDMGASIAKEIAEKTNEEAGDNTTTAVTLGQELFNRGLKHISLGVNAVSIKKGMEMASKEVIDALKAISKPIANDNEIRQVASIAVESPEMGALIAEAAKKVGPNGSISVENGNTVGIVVEQSTGMEFDRGFISPYMMTDSDRMESVSPDAVILVTDYKISLMSEIGELLDAVSASRNRELVIIADDFGEDAIVSIIRNRMAKAMSVLAIKAPGFGERKKDYLLDIATVTGATLISTSTGRALSDVRIEDLGSAERVVSTNTKTKIVGGRGKQENIDARIRAAKAELDKSESKHDKAKIQERIGRLAGGMAIIKVGAATDTEMKYLKDKVEDAVNTTKYAIEEGIVPGGGSAMIRAAMMAEKNMPKGLYTDEVIGYNILISSLKSSLTNIALNGGKGDGSIAVEKVVDMIKSGLVNGGYNALTDKYVDDMFKEGVIDGLKGIRCAVKNASSGIATLLTTQVAIADDPSEKKDGMPMM